MNTMILTLAAISLNLNSETPAPVENSVIVPSSIEKVWDRWTTEEGLIRFFAPAVNIDLEIAGDYEILFAPDNPPGRRGAEGTRLMALEPPHRLAFSWDAPPRWPRQRGQRTLVEIRLAAVDGGTRVSLRHMGWGDGPQWQEVRDYFVGGWEKVLKRLQYSFEVGPVNWDDPPPELMHQG